MRAHTIFSANIVASCSDLAVVVTFTDSARMLRNQTVFATGNASRPGHRVAVWILGLRTSKSDHISSGFSGAPVTKRLRVGEMLMSAGYWHQHEHLPVLFCFVRGETSGRMAPVKTLSRKWQQTRLALRSCAALWERRTR